MQGCYVNLANSRFESYMGRFAFEFQYDPIFNSDYFKRDQVIQQHCISLIILAEKLLSDKTEESSSFHIVSDDKIEHKNC